MYLGKVVEIADRDALFSNPLHPYSQALLASVCVPDPSVGADQDAVLEGDPPSPANPPKGCAFNTRCRYAYETCFAKTPPLVDYGGRKAACHLLNEKQ
jgi:oligopeptide/dipeptide ABC transporter ATP-binding protein